MKNKKLIYTILVSLILVLLSVPVVVLDGDATATVLILMIGICAVYSEIYNIKKEKRKAEKRSGKSEKRI